MAGFFGLFDYNKPGRGVSKEELDKSGISLYFDIFFRRFWKLISMNLIYILFSVPAILIYWFMSNYMIIWLASIAEFDFNNVTQDMASAIFIIGSRLVCVLLAVFGSGSASAAMAYVLRKYVNDTHSWVWSDFWDNFKSNFLQGTLVFIIDCLSLFLLVISLVFYRNMSGIFSLVLSAVVVSIFIVFTMMHMYIYHIMATFKLKTKDIYRNAFLLVMVKLPWNILAFAVFGAIVFGIVYASVMNIIGVLVGIIILFSVSAFTCMFMTNNIVNKYMLEPSLKASGISDDDNGEEPVFEDR